MPGDDSEDTRREFGGLVGGRRGRVDATGRPRATTPRLLRRGLLVLAAVLAAAATGAIAFAPWLLVHHPMWLAALAPDGANLMLVSGSVSFGALAAVGWPMRSLGVLTAYGLGAVYGRVALLRIRSERLLRFVAALERLLARAGPILLVLLPAYTLGLLAGVARLEPRRAVPAIVAGQLAAVTAAYYLGSLVAPWTARVIAFLEANLVESTAVCLVAVVGYRLWRRFR